MINPHEVYKKLTTEGDDWADKHAAAELLEGTLKQVQAQQYLKYRGEGHSQGDCEQHAIADPEYTRARESAIEARKEANRAKVRYNAAQAFFEAQRTAEATHRAAAKAAT